MKYFHIIALPASLLWVTIAASQEENILFSDRLPKVPFISKLSDINNPSPLFRLLMLSNKWRENEIDKGNYFFVNQEFVLDSKNSCALGMLTTYPKEQLPKKWDGQWLKGTKIGEEYQVTFRAVEEELTQSFEGHDNFTISFYDHYHNYGTANQFELFRDTENGPISYKLKTQKGTNVSLTILGAYANAATFNLTFFKSDRAEAIQLTKSVFAQCK